MRTKVITILSQIGSGSTSCAASCYRLLSTWSHIVCIAESKRDEIEDVELLERLAQFQIAIWRPTGRIVRAMA